MKLKLILLAAVLLCGCGEPQPPPPPQREQIQSMHIEPAHTQLEPTMEMDWFGDGNFHLSMHDVTYPEIYVITLPSRSIGVTKDEFQQYHIGELYPHVETP